VQGNIGFDSEWSDEYLRRTTDAHISLTKQDGIEMVKYIIWPESAIPTNVQVDPFILPAISSSLRDGQILLAGAVRTSDDDMKLGRSAFFNTMVILDNKGRTAFYDKAILVPFGEYMPFGGKILTALEGFTAGQGLRVMELVDGTPAFVPLICFESLFSGIIETKSSSSGLQAQWLVNITNDSWFSHSFGIYHLLFAAKVRAIEYGIPIVRVASTGISAVYNSIGHEILSIKENTSGVRDFYLPKPLPTRTFFSILGYKLVPYFIYFLVALFALRYVLSDYMGEIVIMFTKFTKKK
jgi:apolipoprotein N-acyltransferase